MVVVFIGAGPGASDLITLRGIRALKKSDICLYAGSLVNKELLQYLSPDCNVYDSSLMNLDEIKDVFKEAKEKDLNVARLHTGDPSIYGAINEQMKVCDDLSIDYEVVPGVSSFAGAAAVLKTELTLPSVTQTIVLTRAEGRTAVPEKEALEKIAALNATICLFLSAALIEKSVSDLSVHYKKDTPVAVVYRATWKDQKIVRGTLSNIADIMKKEGITKTAMVVVGDVLRNEGELSKLYGRSFSHEYRRGDNE